MSTQIIYFLAISFFACQYIFLNDTISTFILGGLAISILIFGKLTKSVKLKIESYHKHLVVFVIYCFISVLWARDPDLAFKRSLAMAKIFAIIFVVYPVFRSVFNSKQIFSVLMWGGFVVMVYTFIFIGIDNLILLSSVGGRLENDAFINVNVLGVLATNVVLINAFFQIYEKFSWNILINIPCLIIVALCGSRRAFLLLIIGLFILFVLKDIDKKKASLFFKIAIFSIISIIIFYLILTLPMFSVIRERMEGLIAGLTGVGDVDHSTLIRESMREIGYNQFLKTPILGIGIDNARILTDQYLGIFGYLHCNYAELAADLGSIGLFLFYRMYFYIGNNLRKVSLKDSPYNSLVIMMVISMLFSDYGSVTYYYKEFYISIMILYIYIEQIKPQGALTKNISYNRNKLYLLRRKI